MEENNICLISHEETGTFDKTQVFSHSAVENPTQLSLRQIASWQFPDLVSGKPPVLAALPSLQRGAVWKPNQVELLWDSILRGFPVGSLVVCEKLKYQKSRSGIHVEQSSNNINWKEQDYTHHLLDGQQRANAIALGYLDPYRNNEFDAEAETLLWLDLAPKLDRFPQASTRSHLLRVTTMAHPWGFRIGEGKEPQRLVTSDAREAKSIFKTWWSDADNDKRPIPAEGCPWHADVPIPLAWALEVMHQLKCKKDNNYIIPEELWESLFERCKVFIDTHKPLTPPNVSENLRYKHWVVRAMETLRNWLKPPDNNIDKNSGIVLARALERIHSACIIVLHVPTDAVTQPSRTETGSVTASDGEERIANVEHLFQRLNSGGTELRGDDLAYSMIKAYWPKIENTISDIKKRPTETQVALLGARLALDCGKMPPALNVGRLRSIAASSSSNSPQPATDIEIKQSQTNVRQEQWLGEKCKIEIMFGLKGNDLTQSAPIKKAIIQLDNWFLYKKDICNWGLPPVLRSRLADQAPEVFLFLLRLSHYAAENQISPDEDVLKKLLGLATALHWFGIDRKRAVEKLWERDPKNWLDGTAFIEGSLLEELRSMDNPNGGKIATIASILSPQELKDYIDVNTIKPDEIEQWNWWETLVKGKAKSPETDEQRWERYKHIIGVLNSHNYNGTNSLLLMYAQRAQMENYFYTYDPSRVGYWEVYNVPWDFDHILPKNAFYYRQKYGKSYVDVCKQWGFTIGNLHLLPFEKNRSRHYELADESLPEDHEALKRMLLWDTERQGQEDRRSGFSLTGLHVEGSHKDSAESKEKVHQFVLDARARLIRIYSDWFDSLNIKELI